MLQLDFEKVVDRVFAATRRRFPEADYVEDAVLSAIGSLLRRQKELALKTPEDAINLLIRISFCKAVKHYSQGKKFPQTIQNVEDLAVDRRATNTLEDQEWEIRKRQIQKTTRKRLQGLRSDVRESLEPGYQRDIFPYWFAKKYEAKRITKGMIAKKCACSTRTVDRVFHDIEKAWGPRLDEALQDLRRLDRELTDHS